MQLYRPCENTIYSLNIQHFSFNLICDFLDEPIASQSSNISNFSSTVTVYGKPLQVLS